jgi:uncharacterized OsmC-like protein
MSTTSDSASVNGVNTAGLFATIGAVKEQRDLARFQFRTTTQWVSGTHSRTSFDPFHGAGTEHTHATAYLAEADHPAVLVGEDSAPTPVEHLLHALGACLMAGVANIAAARGVELGTVTAEIEGDINLLGLLGIDDTVRNGFEAVRVTFHVEGDAAAEKLAAIVEQSRRRSAVFDVISNGIPVAIEVASS